MCKSKSLWGKKFICTKKIQFCLPYKILRNVTRFQMHISYMIPIYEKVCNASQSVSGVLSPTPPIFLLLAEALISPVKTHKPR